MHQITKSMKSCFMTFAIIILLYYVPVCIVILLFAYIIGLITSKFSIILATIAVIYITDGIGWLFDKIMKKLNEPEPEPDARMQQRPHPQQPSAALIEDKE